MISTLSRSQLWFKSQPVREDLQAFMNFKFHVTYLQPPSMEWGDCHQAHVIVNAVE
jgi:hypothetical protein